MTPNLNQAYVPDTAGKSLVLVGMRASGKTTLGKTASKYLGWKFLDLDDVLEAKVGCACGEYVKQHGWEGFRAEEEIVLREALESNATNTVISCGGGVVESEGARTLLNQYSPVIHIERDINDVIAFLEQDVKDNAATAATTTSAEEEAEDGTARRPNYGESVMDVWLRREPWFKQCRNFHSFVLPKDTDWAQQNLSFERLVGSLQYLPTPHLITAGVSFLDVKLESLSTASFDKQLETLAANDNIALLGKDAVRFAVSAMEESSNLIVAVTMIRKQFPLHPVMVAIVNDISEKGAMNFKGLLETSVQIGCELIEVPAVCLKELDTEAGPGVEVFGGSRLVVSIPRKPSSVDMFQLIAMCARKEVTGVAVTDDVNTSSEAALLHVELVAMKDTMPENVTSVFGCFTGNTSMCVDALHAAHGPTYGHEHSIERVQNARDAMELGRVKRYFLFGSPVQGSPSPTLHNTGFQVYEQRDGIEMNSHYSICDSLSIDKVKQVLSSPSFGGASVTIPHKQAVIPSMHRLTDAAKAINAVNTIIVSRNGDNSSSSEINGDNSCGDNSSTRELIGDNTDWIGIRNLLLQHPKLKARDANAVALVIGAGGTALAACYCATQLGMKLRVYNRTYEKAVEVAERFGGEAVKDIDSVSLPRVDVVIGTVPASSGFALPTKWLACMGAEHGMPVVVDVAYKPRQTALLIGAQEAGCATHQGIEMLIGQGLEQFAIWTKLPAPSQEIETAVLEFYERTTKA